ncbi:MAG: chemotaxis protein CheC [Gemmatimonadota bacterium]
MKIQELDLIQRDGLREVASIGAGHAATALSQLTDRRIMVEVPQIRVFALERIGELTGEAEEVVAAVAMHVLGDVTGRTVQLFAPATASRLAEILLSREEIPFPAGFGELERSSLEEVGNILVGAYLNALSDVLGMLLLPSAPKLAIDMAGAILTGAGIDPRAEMDWILCIDSVFRIDERETHLPGRFLLLPDPGALEAILQAIRLD